MALIDLNYTKSQAFSALSCVINNIINWVQINKNLEIRPYQDGNKSRTKDKLFEKKIADR